MCLKGRCRFPRKPIRGTFAPCCASAAIGAPSNAPASTRRHAHRLMSTFPPVGPALARVKQFRYVTEYEEVTSEQMSLSIAAALNECDIAADAEPERIKSAVSTGQHLFRCELPGAVARPGATAE